MVLEVISISTSPYPGQKPGTSGLRKPVSEVTQPHYVENFIQATLETIIEAETSNNRRLLIGGDGRYYNDVVITKIVRMAGANGFTEVIIGVNGLFSTPACSAYIRENSLVGGILLTASHNPGGENGDFGIKYNTANGGPAPSSLTEAIYDKTTKIKSYKILEEISLDISQIGDTTLQTSLGGMSVRIVNGISCHLNLLKTIFSFDNIREYVSKNSVTGDAMNGVMGNSLVEIFSNELGVNRDSLIRYTSLPDFGGSHPDPNLVYGKELVDKMMLGTLEFGVAFDGDGDRNMILGRNGFFVTPSDSLAVITANHHAIPYFVANKFTGVGRSLPTSRAVDKVAEKLGVTVYETPTGWKYFGSLLDAGLICLCGEESFGTGSSHIREKDGMWAALAWLSILAHKRMSVEDIVTEHWRKYGRHYYSRYDYEGLTSDQGQKIMATVGSYVSGSKPMPDVGSDKIVDSYDFSYTDPVNGDIAKNQGFVFLTKTGSRVIFRVSGTGSSGATIRIYLELYHQDDILSDVQEMVRPLVGFAETVSDIKGISGRSGPTVIT